MVKLVKINSIPKKVTIESYTTRDSIEFHPTVLDWIFQESQLAIIAID